MNEANGFFSIWAQESPYWLVIEGAGQLPGTERVPHYPDRCALRTDANWRTPWATLAERIRHGAPEGAGPRGAVIASDVLPEPREIDMGLRHFREIDAIANNLWLVDDVRHGRLGCYMQRVLDRRGKVVGYEAFARMEGADGGIIGGGAIMQAAGALGIEYQLDRLLHKQAIESFVGSDLEGFIFINFLTGFIHRPEVYLDGLSQAASRCEVRPGAIVLDVPLHRYVGSLPKLKSIAQYCRARGFAMALDDVATTDGLDGLLTEVKPAFVKLDGTLGARLGEPRGQNSLREIIRLAHAAGASVLAEGVENEAMHQAYLSADADMFQGYLFGAPERYPKEAVSARLLG